MKSTAARSPMIRRPNDQIQAWPREKSDVRGRDPQRPLDVGSSLTPWPIVALNCKTAGEFRLRGHARDARHSASATKSDRPTSPRRRAEPGASLARSSTPYFGEGWNRWRCREPVRAWPWDDAPSEINSGGAEQGALRTALHCIHCKENCVDAYFKRRMRWIEELGVDLPWAVMRNATARGC